MRLFNPVLESLEVLQTRITLANILLPSPADSTTEVFAEYSQMTEVGNS